MKLKSGFDGTLLRQLRKDRGLTQRQLGIAAFGYDESDGNAAHQHIYKLERNQKNLSGVERDALAQALRVEITAFDNKTPASLTDTPPEKIPDYNKTDLDMRRLARLAGISSGESFWLMQLAQKLDLPSAALVQCVRDNHVPHNLITRIEAVGYPAPEWVVPPKNYTVGELVSMTAAILLSDDCDHTDLKQLIISLYDHLMEREVK